MQKIKFASLATLAILLSLLVYNRISFYCEKSDAEFSLMQLDSNAVVEPLK